MSQASPIEVTMMSMAPHMHLRGKSFKYELETRMGSDDAARFSEVRLQLADELPAG